MADTPGKSITAAFDALRRQREAAKEVAKQVAADRTAAGSTLDTNTLPEGRQ